MFQKVFIIMFVVCCNLCLGQGRLELSFRPLSVHAPLENGLYKIEVQTPGGWEYLHVANNQKNGHAAVYWNQHGPNSIWKLERQSNGLYSIQVMTPGGWEHLHVANNQKNGHAAVYWNQHGANARWKFSKESNGLYSIQVQTPGGWEYLHVINNQKNGRVGVYWNQHGSNAKWQLKKCDNSTAATKALDRGTNYQIKPDTLVIELGK
ncbi:MAG: hypothetical protein HUU50_08180 [Candidatus Brocadiae bacterium]|nr:hypothetical protein [Candidatus Brocadiia bacterium]